jgi:two-component system response regulator DegU
MLSSVASGRKLQVVIADEHAMFREMLVHVLSQHEGLEVAATVGSIAEIKVCLDRCAADLLLLDVVMPDGSGIDLVKEVKCDTPGIRAVFLTDVDDEDVVLSAIGTGAEGYINKARSVERLLEVLRYVCNGEYAYDHSVTVPILRKIAGAHASAKRSELNQVWGKLSGREKEIAELVSRGLTNKEIAQELFVSVNTVKTHLRKIFQHLEVSSRRELRDYLRLV